MTKKPALRTGEHSGDVPLSLEQEEIWHTWPLPPDSIAHNHPLVLRVDGDFRREAWDRALATLVQRHAALRTRFVPAASGQWRQVVGQAFTPEVAWHDLSRLPPAERDPAWERLVGAAVERSFALPDGRQIRGVGARLDDGSHGVVLVFPRAAVDCWASGVLERELAALYDDPATPLPAATIQYPDYTHWQREWWDGPERERLLGYWRGELVGWQPLKLPTDRPHADLLDPTGDVVPWRLPPDQATALVALARQERTSPFVVLAAAYSALLGEWTGQPDVLVATTLGGRTLPSLSRVVGLFANTVMLRSQLEDGLAFRSLLRAVRRRVIGAFAHQQAPFAQVVADLAPMRDPNLPPLTGALLSHQEFVDPATLRPRPPGPIRAGYRDAQGGMREARRRAARSTLYDLELHTIVNQQMVGGLFEYRSQLFDRASIEALARRFEAVLGRAASDPDGAIR